MNRGITLSRAAQTNYVSSSASGYRFTVTAGSGLNMPNEIFRYARKKINYNTNATTDVFQGICTPEELEALPVGAPDPSDPAQQFRTAALDLLFNTEADASDAWTQIQADINSLILAMKYNDGLGSSQTIRLGDS